jgi:hypothetical protein
MGATSRAGTAHPSGEPAFTPGLSKARVARSLVFCEVFCRLLFSFGFWLPLWYLSTVLGKIKYQNDLFVYLISSVVYIS